MDWLRYIKIGLLGFGGGTAILPLVERELVVGLHVIPPEKFAEIVAVCAMVPGALAANLLMFMGYLQLSIPGMFGGLVAAVLPGAVCSYFTARSSRRAGPDSILTRTLMFLKPAVAALAVCAAIGIWRQSISDWMTLVLAVLALGALKLTHLNPALVVALAGSTTLLFSYLRS
jgi:chromate transporter